MSLIDLFVARQRRSHRAALPLIVALLALRRQRARLALLDDRELADLGLTRAEALCESRRPVWDAPDHWTK